MIRVRSVNTSVSKRSLYNRIAKYFTHSFKNTLLESEYEMDHHKVLLAHCKE